MSAVFYDWLDDNVPCKGERSSGLTPAQYRVMLSNYAERKGMTLAALGLTAESAEKYIGQAMEQTRDEVEGGKPIAGNGLNLPLGMYVRPK